MGPVPVRIFKRSLQSGLLFVTLLSLLGAGDAASRFADLGHRMMCVCGCHQILLECNHVGCQYSSRMREELTAAVDRESNDDLALQWFVQTYGTTVIAAPSSQGFDRVAWIMPYLVLVFGLSTVVLIVRAWKNRPLILSADSVKPIIGAELDHFREQARNDTEEGTKGDIKK
jgi:cytochrome c-type biogenesis protein CcmH